MWHDWFVYVTWLIHTCDMTHSYVWHDSFLCVTWLIHIVYMTYSYVWRDSFICVAWLIHMCDMSHSCVLHDSFTCMTWLIHMCGHDSFICVAGWLIHLSCDAFIRVTWLIHWCDTTHAYMWHDSALEVGFYDVENKVSHDAFTFVAWLIHMWHAASICTYTHTHTHTLTHTHTHTHMCDMTRSLARDTSFIRDTNQRKIWVTNYLKTPTLWGHASRPLPRPHQPQSLSKHYSTWDPSCRPHSKLLGIRRVSNPSTSIVPGTLKIGFPGTNLKYPFCSR